MKVFISGASGLVGGQCLDVFSKKNKYEVIGSHLSYPTDKTVYFDTLNPANAENFKLIDWQPDVIIHCGALTHVDYCETHKEESYEKTVQSTINLKKVASAAGAQLVLLSTDYVFDGEHGPYTEAAPENPLSVYGEHKLMAEKHVDEATDLIIRITNVYGDEIRHKNFISRIVQQCKEGQSPVFKLPKDQYATPTNAADIAAAIELLVDSKLSGIYHISSTDFMNRVELAQKVMSYFPDTDYLLEAVTTAALGQPAARPLMGGLISEKFKSAFPSFRFSSVDNYMASIVKEMV